MITNDAADVLSEVFAQHAQDRADTQIVLTDLHRRIDQRRHIPSRPVAMLATAAAVVALALGATALADRQAQPVPLAGRE